MSRRGLCGGFLVLLGFLDHGLDLRSTTFGLAAPGANAYLSPQRLERQHAFTHGSHNGPHRDAAANTYFFEIID